MEFCHAPGRLYAEDANGVLLAEITFPTAGDGVADLNHTIVHPSLQGQGVADRLVRAAAEQLRLEGRKARVSCSYATHWFQRHPQYRDVLF